LRIDHKNSEFHCIEHYFSYHGTPFVILIALIHLVLMIKNDS